MLKLFVYLVLNDLNRCGVIQEGDRIIAINGQYLEGRTMEEIYGFIAESPVKMILTVEFRVAGMFNPLSVLIFTQANLLICIRLFLCLTLCLNNIA